MSAIQDRVTIAAAGAVNILDGSAFETLEENSMIQIALIEQGNADLRATIYLGGELLAEESFISQANRVPIIPDDIQFEGVGLAGERLVIRIRNIDAVNASTLDYAVRITPIG